MFMTCPLLAKAQGSSVQLNNLWKDYDQAMEKDLPQTCLKILDKISKKSESEKAYASLLKAELKKVEIMDELAPDSVEIMTQNLLNKTEKMKSKDKVAYAIFNLAISRGFQSLRINNGKYADDYREEAFADMDVLANTTTDDWAIIIKEGSGSEIFNRDILSLMGIEAYQQERLFKYYKEHGNRRACAYLAQNWNVNKGNQNLPTYIEEYKDLPEGALLAKQYYQYCKGNSNISAAERYQLLQTYRKQWAGTKEATIFENFEKNEQQASLKIVSVPGNVRSDKVTTLQTTSKNVSKAKLTIIPLNVASRDIPVNDHNKYYENLLSNYAVKSGNGYKGQIEIAKNFNIENYYTEAKDSITIPTLKCGVYMLKLESQDEKDQPSYKHPDGFSINKPSTHTVDYTLFHVSDLKIIRLSLPNKKERMVVVDSKTGHEVKNAKTHEDKYRGIVAYTDTDNGMPYARIYPNEFHSYTPEKEDYHINMYLDRGIYRPGQTVHVAAISHKITNGIKTNVVANEEIEFTLKDANYLEIASKTVKTDDFGTATADFVLPTDRLTGEWLIEVEGEEDETEMYFNVEEYKRPTFEVTFKKYEKEYQLGDTIKVTGVAKTYAGVPVANAKVAYTVNRQLPWWCWWRGYGIGDIKRDTVVTNDKGEFEATVPLSIPKDQKIDDKNDIICYHYKIEAAVTSISGETREGEESLTASNKPLMFKISIKDKFRNDENSGFSVSVKNSAGKDMKEAKLAFKIDNQSKQYSTVKEVNEAIKTLPSGKHKIIGKASYKDIVENDTVNFTIFSLDDKTPVEYTKHWNYITHQNFKDENDVITLQFGTSTEDVEVFYDVFEGDKHKESTVLHASNSLIRKDFKAVKGKNILVSYAWVKNDTLYSHQYCLYQPEPEKSLNVTWKTFRNRLIPGQKEEWTLNITNPRTKGTGDYQLLANLYDKSLDAIASSAWNTRLGINTGYSSAEWTTSHPTMSSLRINRYYEIASFKEPDLSRFYIWPFRYEGKYRNFSKAMLLDAAAGGARVYDLAEEQPRFAPPVVKKDSEVIANAAQEVSGTVVDEFGEPIIGVMVKEQDTQNSVVTDIDGNYTIRLSQKGASIIVSYIGYMSQTLSTAGISTLNVTLEEDRAALEEVVVAGYGVLRKNTVAGKIAGIKVTPENATTTEPIQMRSNFSETAFFYPQLFADKNGDVNIKFTLPESTTTWKFRALAHDKEMNNGMIQEEVIAQKQLMISPNMPRFIRKGDKGVLASVVSNLSEKTLNTKTTIEILDPDTEKVLYTESTTNTLEAGKTAAVNFNLKTPSNSPTGGEQNLAEGVYIVKIFTESLTHVDSSLRPLEGVGGPETEGVSVEYSDGEQHYLAIIDNVEPVMTTKSITMIKPGTETVTTADLFPADATDKKLTVEWTENPAWLMLETLPYMNSQDQTTIYSKAAAYYANALGANILKAMPEKTKQTILRQNETAPVREASASGNTAASPLEKNPELKTLLLNETPWVMDAKNETERIKMLRNFYDENKLTYNQEQLIKKLKDEQKSDGGWSWCPDMQTSYWMTSEICELFVRLNNMIGKQEATSDMLKKALNCLQKKAHEEIILWKKDEKNGVTPYIYDCYALQYVYLKALSGEKLAGEEKKDADFVIKYLKKQERQNSLYMKAKLAIVLYYMGETKMAKEYIQSINEYSAYKELDGRYFDTRRAGYSWRDYKQPTQTMVIEALKAITPNDQQTIAEYQRWLLMQKRNQMWDTPINTVNNVYAFVSPSRSGSKNSAKAPASTKSAPVSEASASDYAIINAFGADGKGYSKNIYVDKNILPIVEFEKTNNQVSWGAVYAQFKQKATNIADFSEGLKITREIITPEGSSLHSSEGQGVSVGDKVKVRITVVADRDYDFVQIVDKRAACLEPVSQTSGYRWSNGGYYEAPQDSRTCYYCDMLRKGTHTFETEYFIDRVGDYQSGTCTVQCAYSPEFYGRTGAININVTP